MITARDAAEWIERRRTARATARVPTEQLQKFRDHAAGLGLETSREHYDALLARRARREARNSANRSWNAALAAIAICAAVFFASAIASATGWHPAFTGPATGACALAMVASGVWLHMAAARLEPLEPDEDEEAGAS